MPADIPLLILAGGRATRLGGVDKTLLELEGRSVLARIVDRLGPAHRHVAISANGPPGRFAAHGLPVLPDAEPHRGPLGGILAGLVWAERLGAATLLTVPGDAPFLPPDLAARLAPAPAMAESGGRRHPPASLWPVALRGLLAAHLAATDAASGRALAVVAFADAVGMRQVAFDGAEADPFQDVDTPEDLVRARARVRAEGGRA